MPTKKSEAFDADHDRIVMASVNKDGTLDQNDPEFIGGQFSVDASRRQAEVRAASLVDQAHAADTGVTGSLPGSGEATGETKKLKDQQDKAAKAAADAAEKLVKANEAEEPEPK